MLFKFEFGFFVLFCLKKHRQTFSQSAMFQNCSPQNVNLFLAPKNNCLDVLASLLFHSRNINPLLENICCFVLWKLLMSSPNDEESTQFLNLNLLFVKHFCLTGGRFIYVTGKILGIIYCVRERVLWWLWMRGPKWPIHVVFKFEFAFCRTLLFQKGKMIYFKLFVIICFVRESVMFVIICFVGGEILRYFLEN